MQCTDLHLSRDAHAHLVLLFPVGMDLKSPQLQPRGGLAVGHPLKATGVPYTREGPSALPGLVTLAAALRMCMHALCPRSPQGPPPVPPTGRSSIARTLAASRAAAPLDDSHDRCWRRPHKVRRQEGSGDTGAAIACIRVSVSLVSPCASVTHSGSRSRVCFGIIPATFLAVECMRSM